MTTNNRFVELFRTSGERNRLLGYEYELAINDGPGELSPVAARWSQAHRVPEEVLELWRGITSAHLDFRADDPGGTGIELWGSAESIDQTAVVHDVSGLESYDTVVGTERGVAVYLTVSAPTTSGYRVLMADLDIDRSEWVDVGGSLFGFLELWSEEPGYDFWNYE